MNVKKQIAATAMALSLVAGVALAATTTTPDPQTAAGPGYGIMGGPGMMKGRGMMWDNNQDCFRNNGGPGMGMGHRGIMQGRHGMNGCGAILSPEMTEKRNKFLDATVELRKQIHDKQFAYREATRNPAMTQGELQAQEKELYTMRQELQSKRQAAFAAE